MRADCKMSTLSAVRVHGIVSTLFDKEQFDQWRDSTGFVATFRSRWNEDSRSFRKTNLMVSEIDFESSTKHDTDMTFLTPMLFDKSAGELN